MSKPRKHVERWSLEEVTYAVQRAFWNVSNPDAQVIYQELNRIAAARRKKAKGK